jgi:hypothetical protein
MPSEERPKTEGSNVEEDGDDAVNNSSSNTARPVSAAPVSAGEGSHESSLQASTGRPDASNAAANAPTGDVPADTGAINANDAIAQAVESGQRIYENTYKLKPDRKYQLLLYFVVVAAS